MNRPLMGLAVLALAAGIASSAPPQTIQHETSVFSVEIPVRVFKGADFVDNLTLGDFELYEDGKPQTIEAFFLVKKTIIERREEVKEFSPRTARHFYLFFELGEYEGRILQALDYFVKTVLLPGDNLTIVTPMKTYRMKGNLFGLVGREKTYAQIIGILRRDIQIGYAESRAVLSEMTDLARVMASEVRAMNTGSEAPDASLVEPPPVLPVESAYSGAFEVQLMHYATLVDRLANLRVVDPRKLLGFARTLKDIEGQKSVYFFYQAEYVPKIDPRIVEMLATRYSDRPDIAQSLDTIFGLDRRDVSVDVDDLTKAYADASASIHFLHLPRPPERFEGIRLEERSEDVFAPFREMARATGGYTGSTANIAAAMRSAVEFSESYYLLYYTPPDYRPDNRFRRVTVEVKGGGYRVSHRLGYIAD